MPKLSIVIGVRNRSAMLKNCLRSLSLQDSKDFEVIIVDYGGTDDIEGLVHDYGFTKYIYTHNTGIYSRTHSLNIGIRNAASELILCTDADIIFAPNFVTAALKAASEGAIVLCHCLRLSPKFIKPYFKYQEIVKKSTPGHEFSIGGCQMLHRKVWNEIRGWDEDIVGWGSEDWDIMHRLKRKGIKEIYIHHKTSIIHQNHDPCFRTAYRNDILWALHDKMIKERVKDIKRNTDRAWGKIYRKPRKRILNIMVSGSVGGVEMKAYNFIRNLDREIYEVYSVITDTGGPMSEKFQEASDLCLNLVSISPKKKFSILKDLIRDVSFDIMHIWNSPLGDQLALLFKGRIVIGIYGDYSNPGPFYNTRIKNIEKLKGRDLILITDNPTNKMYFPAHRVDYIHTGIDDPHPTKEKIERVNKRCIWVGRSGTEKNLNLYLKIAKQLPDYEFLLLIPEYPETALYVTDNVTIHIGVTDRKKLYDFYKSANIYINTSFTEGLPQALLESMKSKCFPIVPDIGGIKYALEGRGSLISYSDIKKGNTKPFINMIKAYSELDPQVQMNRRKNIRRKAKKYSIKNMIAEIEAVYDLKSGGSSPYPSGTRMLSREGFTKSKLLIIVDVYGWAWDIASKELLPYLPDITGEIIDVSDFLKKKIKQTDYDFVIAYPLLSKDVMDKLDPARTIVCVAGGDIDRYKYSFKISCERFHHFAACNSIIQKALQKRYPDKNVFVLSHGVDTDLFQPRKSKHKKFTIGWAGRTKRPLKRFDLAKQIVEKLGVELKVADFYGDGDYEYYDHKDMPDFFNNIDCLLATSETEAHPMVIYEAMASGKPVVTTRVGDLGETIVNGKNGILLPIDAPVDDFVNMIKVLIRDEEYRDRIGMNARETILDNWTWDKIAPQYMTLEELL